MEEDLKKREQACKIAAEALVYGKSLAKPGIKLIELADAIENKIEELGGKVGFPVNLSLNAVAAHFTPLPNDETVLKENDTLKIDVGAHVDGYVGDNALTIGPNKELNDASKEALNNAIKILKPGVKLSEIGKVIQDTISKKGFQPVINLSGHGLERWTVHSWPSVPNYDNQDDTELKKGQIIAIEPFATTGQGKVIEGGDSNIYKLEKDIPIRDPMAREVLKFIKKEYNTLPFSGKWIIRKFKTGVFSLRVLEQAGIIHHYKQLREINKGIVSQHEHTVKIDEKPQILTKV